MINSYGANIVVQDMWLSSVMGGPQIIQAMKACVLNAMVTLGGSPMTYKLGPPR